MVFQCVSTNQVSLNFWQFKATVTFSSSFFGTLDFITTTVDYR
jgi:hypothetical protein